ncbi:MAG: oxidoreductase [Thermosynechococcus sp.]|uniref:NAD(P)H-quinone oxidoreductase subunit F n=1 Tax=Thermosynechococcus sp. TaxID=2814275 RepID=UPI002201CF96|nr:NAD(P)H-quinone oxidoreductase subunit F [Thermosynechococcus sp.]BCX12891.1 MAG: oxidoreductase [Thermosynechococcus sp.]
MLQSFADTVWLIPFYSLLGMVLSLIWSPGITRKTGPRPAGYLNILLTFFSFVHALLATVAIANQPPRYLHWTWLDVAGLHFDIPVEISILTTTALMLITGLNLMAQVFAVGYMEMDWGWARFFALLALFEGGMGALVLLDSLFFSYVVLEILTLATYLLIGLWFNQPLVVTGARDAFLTKRVGDLVLLMGVLAIYPLAGSWNYDDLAAWAATAQVNPTLITLICLALIAGPMGKCAQFPLHLWLDEAMEGPIPASILRNAVVVATGAWVLVKLTPVLSLSPLALTALLVIGSVTALGGSLIAIAQVDIKRALSYLVSAYMGWVFIAVGLREPGLALVFILAYGLAMALLMMSIGGIIWNSITQDLRLLGGLWSRRPISGISFLVGSAGLLAVPPLGSFFPQAELLDTAFAQVPWVGGVLLLMNAFAAFSLGRTFCLIWGGEVKPMTARSPEVFWPMILPMTVDLGLVLHLPILMGRFDWVIWTQPTLATATALTVTALVGWGAAAWVYLGNAIPKPVQFPLPSVQELLAYDFYTPKLYRATVVGVVDIISRITAWFDRTFVDGTGNTFGLVTLLGGDRLKYSTTGQSQAYILTILVGVAILVIAICWPLLA